MNSEYHTTQIKGRRRRRKKRKRTRRRKRRKHFPLETYPDYNEICHVLRGKLDIYCFPKKKFSFLGTKNVTLLERMLHYAKNIYPGHGQ